MHTRTERKCSNENNAKNTSRGVTLSKRVGIGSTAQVDHFVRLDYIDLSLGHDYF